MSIARTVVIAQGKGGVGKTSVATNVAGLVAAAGRRVLLVDLDPQGNAARDLGLAPSDGAELFTALLQGLPLPVVKDVRSYPQQGGRLDVTQGGQYLSDLAGVAFNRVNSGAANLVSTVEKSVASVAGGYDLIVIDTPPGERVLVEAALGIASAVLIPTRADEASLDGLIRVAERFVAARQVNPELRLAGVVLFGIGSRSARLTESVREHVGEMIGGAAPVFASTIRHLESASVDARSRGLLIHELEGAVAEDKRRRLNDLKKGKKTHADALLSRNATGLAGDYEALAVELLNTLAQIENDRIAS